MAAPGTQATNIVFSNVAATSATVGWTRGNGANVAVFIKAASSTEAAPIDTISYSANTVFGAGGTDGAGYYCIYNDTGTSVNITGLTPSTTYRVHACEYNGLTGAEEYNVNTATGNPANTTTGAAASPMFMGHRRSREQRRRRAR